MSTSLSLRQMRRDFLMEWLAGREAMTMPELEAALPQWARQSLALAIGDAVLARRVTVDEDGAITVKREAKAA